MNSHVVLVTGGAGFIGANFARHVLDACLSRDLPVMIILLDVFADKPYKAALKRKRVSDMFGITFPLKGISGQEQVENNKGIDERIRMVGGCAGDIELNKHLISTYKVTCVIHAAACANVRCVEKIQNDSVLRVQVEDTNVRTLERLLAALQMAACDDQLFCVESFVFISSSTVYGEVIQPLSTSKLDLF